MKRLLFSLLVCLSVACSALAQRTPDTIYLKNGSILYGQIIEELAGGQVKIRLSDGSLLICPYADLERVEYSSHRAYLYEEPRVPRADWHFDAGYLFGASNRQHAGLFASYGARFNRSLFLGIGSGFIYGMVETLDMVIPVYGHLRAYLPVRGPIKPFVDLRPGYSFAPMHGISGFYGTALVGLDIWRFTCGAGIGTVCNAFDKLSLPDRTVTPFRATGLTLHIGMTL